MSTAKVEEFDPLVWQQTLLEAPIVVYQLEDLAKTS
jgi:hypothetical protein